jgi:hypothetical protein
VVEKAAPKETPKQAPKQTFEPSMDQENVNHTNKLSFNVQAQEFKPSAPAKKQV